MASLQAQLVLSTSPLDPMGCATGLLWVFSNLGFRAKIKGNFGINSKGFCGENIGVLVGYGLGLIWSGKWRVLRVGFGDFYGVTKIEKRMDGIWL